MRFLSHVFYACMDACRFVRVVMEQGPLVIKKRKVPNVDRVSGRRACLDFNPYCILSLQSHVRSFLIQ